MLACMSCLIIGPSSQLTAFILRRRFTLNISSEKLTGSAADFSFARQKTPKKLIKHSPCYCCIIDGEDQFPLSMKIFDCDLKSCLEEGTSQRKSTPTLRIMTARQSKPGQCKDPEQNNHSVLPVHLFTVPTDLILSHTYAGQGKRPRHRADPTQHMQICEINRFRSNRIPSFSSIVFFNSRPSGCCRAVIQLYFKQLLGGLSTTTFQEAHRATSQR